MGARHHGYEWALAFSRLGPWNQGQDDRHSQQVEDHQACDGGAESPDDGPLRILRFSCRHRDHLDAQVAEDGDNDGYPHAPCAPGKESPVGSVVGKTGAPQQPSAEQDEHYDCRYLQAGEGIFHGAEHFHVERVHGDQDGGESDDPDPAWHHREPIAHVDSNGTHFRAYCEDHARPIGIANHEPGQGPDIKLRPRAEGARSWMRHRHFGETPHQHKCDERADGVADDYRRPGKTNGKTAAQKQSGTNGATDGDHAELRRAEPTVQSLLPILNSIEAFGVHRFWCQPSVNGRPKGDPRDAPPGWRATTTIFLFATQGAWRIPAEKVCSFQAATLPTLSAILWGDGFDEEQRESL